MRGALRAAVIGLASFGFAPSAFAQCDYDSECGSESVCRDGQCRAQAPSREEPRPRSYGHGKRIGKPGLLAAGIVIATAGPVVTLVGILSTQCKPGPTCNESRIALWGLAGGALIGLGVPLIVMGAKRVPERQVVLLPSFAPNQAGLSVRLTL